MDVRVQSFKLWFNNVQPETLWGVYRVPTNTFIWSYLSKTEEKGCQQLAVFYYSWDSLFIFLRWEEGKAALWLIAAVLWHLEHLLPVLFREIFWVYLDLVSKCPRKTESSNHGYPPFFVQNICEKSCNII